MLDVGLPQVSFRHFQENNYPMFVLREINGTRKTQYALVYLNLGTALYQKINLTELK